MDQKLVLVVLQVLSLRRISFSHSFMQTDVYFSEHKISPDRPSLLSLISFSLLKFGHRHSIRECVRDQGPELFFVPPFVRWTVRFLSPDARPRHIFCLGPQDVVL